MSEAVQGNNADSGGGGRGGRGRGYYGNRGYRGRGGYRGGRGYDNRGGRSNQSQVNDAGETGAGSASEGPYRQEQQQQAETPAPPPSTGLIDSVPAEPVTERRGRGGGRGQSERRGRGGGRGNSAAPGDLGPPQQPEVVREQGGPDEQPAGESGNTPDATAARKKQPKKQQTKRREEQLQDSDAPPQSQSPVPERPKPQREGARSRVPNANESESSSVGAGEGPPAAAKESGSMRKKKNSFQSMPVTSTQAQTADREQQQQPTVVPTREPPAATSSVPLRRPPPQDPAPTAASVPLRMPPQQDRVPDSNRIPDSDRVPDSKRVPDRFQRAPDSHLPPHMSFPRDTPSPRPAVVLQSDEADVCASRLAHVAAASTHPPAAESSQNNPQQSFGVNTQFERYHHQQQPQQQRDFEYEQRERDRLQRQLDQLAYEEDVERRRQFPPPVSLQNLSQQNLHQQNVRQQQLPPQHQHQQEDPRQFTPPVSLHNLNQQNPTHLNLNQQNLHQSQHQHQQPAFLRPLQETGSQSSPYFQHMQGPPPQAQHLQQAHLQRGSSGDVGIGVQHPPDLVLPPPGLRLNVNNGLGASARQQQPEHNQQQGNWGPFAASPIAPPAHPSAGAHGAHVEAFSFSLNSRVEIPREIKSVPSPQARNESLPLHILERLNLAPSQQQGHSPLSQHNNVGQYSVGQQPPGISQSSFGQQNIGLHNVGQQDRGLHTVGQQDIGQRNMSHNSGQHNVGQHNVGQPNVGGQHGVASHNVDQQDIGQRNMNHNIAQQNLGQHNVAQHNVGSHNVGQHNVGQHNVGQHNVGQPNVGGQHNVGPPNLGQHNVGGQHSVGPYNVGQHVQPPPGWQHPMQHTQPPMQHTQQPIHTQQPHVMSEGSSQPHVMSQGSSQTHTQPMQHTQQPHAMSQERSSQPHVMPQQVSSQGSYVMSQQGSSHAPNHVQQQPLYVQVQQTLHGSTHAPPSAPLPPPPAPVCQWKEAEDPSTGKMYYYHKQTLKVQWERPEELGGEPATEELHVQPDEVEGSYEQQQQHHAGGRAYDTAAERDMGINSGFGYETARVADPILSSTLEEQQVHEPVAEVKGSQNYGRPDTGSLSRKNSGKSGPPPGLSADVNADKRQSVDKPQQGQTRKTKGNKQPVASTDSNVPMEQSDKRGQDGTTKVFPAAGDRGSKSNGKGGKVHVDPVADAAAPRVVEERNERRPKRITDEQVGWVHVSGLQDGPATGTVFSCCTVRPRQDLTVRWDLPAELIEKSGRTLMVGLFRLGFALNKPSIVSRRLLDRLPARRPGTELSTQTRVHGSMQFFAPKSVGTFVFRIFDEENDLVTRATSPPWEVEVQGRDVEPSVRYALQQLRDTAGPDGRGTVSAMSQLTHVLEHLKHPPPQRYVKFVAESVWAAVKAAQKLKEPVKNSSEDIGGPEDSRVRTIQGAVWCVLNAAVKNPVAKQLLEQAGEGGGVNPVAEIQHSLAMWSPLEERFFDSAEILRSQYMTSLGLIPSRLDLDISQVTPAISAQARELLPSLLPSNKFFKLREHVRSKLEKALVTSREIPEIPEGTILRVFGSSINGFGGDSSDLDMCLLYPQAAKSPSAPGALIESIAKKLQAEGLRDVDCRETARIPIVIFKDPDTHLDCDISVMNPLALKNTDLLRAYAAADGRVRQLAFIIKHWAKRRRINNASEGTLSSYGYILCLLHFLQTRSPPVVPNLQALPLDWKGDPTQTPTAPTLKLPQFMTHSLDGKGYNTYFFAPTPLTPPDASQTNALQDFALQNKETVGQLLAGFFRYFAWDFNCRQHVVSLRAGGVQTKGLKAENDSWAVHTRLSVEDPFETWYDVAHVLKWSRHKHIHGEFIRAYALICDATRNNSLKEQLLDVLCAEADIPPFLMNEKDSSNAENDELAEAMVQGLTEQM